MFRTQAATGTVLPLFAGVIFVAVMLPSTMPHAAASLTEAVLAGLVSNLIILAIILALAAVLRRLRG
jgi:hypothetical protein